MDRRCTNVRWNTSSAAASIGLVGLSALLLLTGCNNEDETGGNCPRSLCAYDDTGSDASEPGADAGPDTGADTTPPSDTDQMDPEDTGGTDTGADTTPSDTSPSDTTPSDTAHRDSGNRDTGSTDSGDTTPYGTGCLAVSHSPTVDFGASSQGRTATKTVTVENCQPRSGELRIDSIRITDDAGGAFSLKQSSLPGGLPSGTATLDAGERANFVVEFSPSARTNYQGTLVIRNNDPANPDLHLQLTGRGSAQQCPQAQASGTVKGGGSSSASITTQPLETVQLSASGSSAPNGQIKRYQWSIIARPTDSTARLVPASDRKNPTLFLDLAGTYKVELVVYDDQDTASCGQRAVVTIEAVPQQDIYVEMVWDTPADGDQTDSNGSDVDLHYLNPKGDWNKKPWDIFWHNPTADWGQTGNSNDDPEMLVDDTDGAGPEVVAHDNPAAGMAYKIGVYYYDDNGYGPSYATTRIYIDGSLAEEYSDKFLEKTYDFWLVALVEWPTQKVYKRDQKMSGFPMGSP